MGSAGGRGVVRGRFERGIKSWVGVVAVSVMTPSASVADGRPVAVADAAPGSGNAGGREEHALSEVSAIAARPALCG